MPLFQPVTRCAAFLDYFDQRPPPYPLRAPLFICSVFHTKNYMYAMWLIHDILHLWCDIWVPLTRVNVLLPLISSITASHESLHGALLDSRPAFPRTPHFRLFMLLSTDMSVKSGIWARMHENSAG
jgi:hypothetical protein